MASAAAATGWLRGRVKAVTSGDTLVIMGSSKAEIPPEKTITLSSINAPKLARRGTLDEPFAWDSREYLRKLCIGKEVTFKVDYAAATGREFGSVFMGDQNVATLVVSKGWAKVKESGQQKGEASPFLAELQKLEEKAKQDGVGRYSQVPGASEASIRRLPPSGLDNASGFDAMALLSANKGKTLDAVVEQVRDGSTLRVYLLPEFQFVQVFVAGVQAPSMGRRTAIEALPEPEIVTDDTNGDAPAENRPLTSAQRLAASSTPELSADPFGREAKHFTEIRVLSREVRVALEGVDKFNNLIGSVHYADGDTVHDLAVELVQNGLAKYVEWSANMLPEDAKRKLKNAELQAKKDRLRMWTNYVPPASNSKAIHDQNFSGKVVEVVSGDCVVVADDSVPYGSPSAERRVNLSSIRAPKIGNPRREEKPAPYAREAKEFLRTRLIGRQVHVQMEYSRKVTMSDLPGQVAAAGSADSKIMDFGTVFLASPSKADADDVTSSATGQTPGQNISEVLVGRGFATVIRHRDFEERSNYYDALLAAESRAISGRKGLHSAKDPPVVHITDLTTTPAKKATSYLPFLQRIRRHQAVVDYVLSGHRFKLVLAKETCSIAFSFSGVRCPGRGEPYSEDAIALMRRKILQRDVEISCSFRSKWKQWTGPGHSAKDPPVVHITDLTTTPAKKATSYLPFLQRIRRHQAVVDYVLSGHRFKLVLAKETCSIAFSFSGVRCPGRGEPYSEDAIALMRRKILQRDVEVEVEAVDRAGTFLGSMWESKTNVAITLLEAGLARFQANFGADRVPDAQLLMQAEEKAKKQKLKIWENFVEGQESANGSGTDNRKKEVLKVVVTDVLDGGKFYIQTAGDQMVASIQQQLASLTLREAPVIGAFNPNKGELVLAQYSCDNSWNRAMIVNGPRKVETPKDNFDVFYIDYGNQETVPYSRLRPLDPSVSNSAGLAQLCTLAYVKVPGLEDDFGPEAAQYLCDRLLKPSKEFKAQIEDRDTSAGKAKGRGTGTVLVVSLVDIEEGSSVNADILQEGLAKLERKMRWDSRERQAALDNLQEHQDKAKRERRNIWQYGDVQSDDEEAPPVRKPAAAGGRR